MSLLGKAEKGQLEELILTLIQHFEQRGPSACYLTAGTRAMPRDALPSLATEATSAAAARINRLAPG